MADDINLTTILAPLSAAAQVRRVKPTDPENERRSPDEQRRERRKNKDDQESKHANDAVDVTLNTPAQLEDAQRKARPQKQKMKSDNRKGKKEKSINIRV